MKIKYREVQFAILNGLKQYYFEEGLSIVEINEKLSFLNNKQSGGVFNVPEELLEKIDVLDVVITPLRSKDKLEDVTKELTKVIEKTNIKAFSFNCYVKDYKYIHPFLDSLNDDIVELKLAGVDFSEADINIFKRFQNLYYFELEKCTILDPDIVSGFNDKTRLSLIQNIILSDDFEKIMQAIQDKGVLLKFGNLNSNKLVDLYSNMEMEIIDYWSAIEAIDSICSLDVDSIKNITINMTEEFDFEEDIDDEFYDETSIFDFSEDLIDLLNSKENIHLLITKYNLDKIDPLGELKVPMSIMIDHMIDLNLEDIANYKNIEQIRLSFINSPSLKLYHAYSVDKYLEMLNEVDNIKSMINIPDYDDPDREKKIFAQIYKILGENINYDYIEVNKGMDTDFTGSNSSNQASALLENKTCSKGFAETLRNVLLSFNIRAGTFVGDNGWAVDEITESKTKKAAAWNGIILDGKFYWTNLAMDEEAIKMGEYPLKYCLKATEDFKTHYRKQLNEAYKLLPAEESLPIDEQYELFTGEKYIAKEETNKSKVKVDLSVAKAIFNILYNQDREKIVDRTEQIEDLSDKDTKRNDSRNRRRKDIDDDFER